MTRRVQLSAPGTAPRRAALGLGLLLVLLPGVVAALGSGDNFDLSDLEKEAKLTPRKFANLFEEFSYEYFPYVQSPDVFLRSRTGDCDDYAILAGHVLSRHAYQTRLIRIELVGQRISHVICYVQQDRAYLDYNNRAYFINLEKCGPRLRQIAERVADSFRNNWTTATEYTFSYAEGRSRALRTVVKTDPPDRDPDRDAR